MLKTPYTYEKNIKKIGETVSGANMFAIIDSKGQLISKMHAFGLDYELATIYVDWINEENTKPNSLKHIIPIIKEREK